MSRLVSAHDGPSECIVCSGPIDLHSLDDPAVSLSCDGRHILHKYCWDNNTSSTSSVGVTAQCPMCRKPCDAQLVTPPSPEASSPIPSVRAGGGLESAGGGFASMVAPEAEAEDADAAPTADATASAPVGSTEVSAATCSDGSAPTADATASAYEVDEAQQEDAETLLIRQRRQAAKERFAHYDRVIAEDEAAQQRAAEEAERAAAEKVADDIAEVEESQEVAVGAELLKQDAAAGAG